MPDVGDTIRYNTTYLTGGIDYTLTDPDYTWDFSNLSSFLGQEADTFVHVWSTPVAYQVVFLYPFVSTIALPLPDFTLISGFEMTNVYDYYKESSAEFKEVGIGFNVNGVPFHLNMIILILFMNSHFNTAILTPVRQLLELIFQLSAITAA